ncbi:MAG: 4-hydroxy-tetrahydrodipicolinate reductase [Alphaproteobacteria bacterium]|nr:4-hydroxy-tetrahydrodipicolinate reductase [Alphaproteobacteria bacterium]
MKIGICGCQGRMGQMLCEAVREAGEELAGGTERADHPALNTVLGSGKIVSNSADLFEVVEGVIDFSCPANSVENAKIAAKYGKPLVIGTTGLTDEQKSIVAECAKKTAIVFAPNMSVGVTLLMALAKKTAELLDPSYDIEIVEMHHRNKVDAPSGTALGLGHAVADGRKVALKDVACYDRHGQIGKRPVGEIGFATLRGGDVVGDHTVIFAGTGERIELTHKASSRAVFAKGAVRALQWLSQQKPGLYNMADVLGLN